MIHHLILSRFAIGSKPFMTKEWVDHRLNLLEKYCYPSMANQNCNNFRWIVASHRRNINNEQLDRLNKMKKIENILLDNGEGYKGGIMSICKSLLSHETDILITTRIDCDDIVHKYFTYEIQKNCTHTIDKYTLNFSTGYEYDTTKKLLTMRSRKDTNMFVSLVEKNTTEIKTVLCEHHQRLKNRFPNYQLYTNKPMWIQLIHGSNIATKKNKSPRVIDKNSVDFKKDFNVTL